MHNYIKQKLIWCYINKSLVIFFEQGDTLENYLLEIMDLVKLHGIFAVTDTRIGYGQSNDGKNVKENW